MTLLGRAPERSPASCPSLEGQSSESLARAAEATSTLHWFGEATSHADGRRVLGTSLPGGVKRPLDYGHPTICVTADTKAAVREGFTAPPMPLVRASSAPPIDTGFVGAGLGRPGQRVPVAGGLLWLLCWVHRRVRCCSVLLWLVRLRGVVSMCDAHAACARVTSLLRYRYATCSGGLVATPTVVRCLLYTSPSPRDGLLSRMPSSA